MNVSGNHPGRAAKRQSFCLLSFSPAQGIGFYEADGALYVLDLIRAQDLCVDTAVASYIYTLTGQQLEAGLIFATKKEMMAFLHREYLRDKKNNYYAEVFTRRLNVKHRMKMLKFLNDEKLRGIQVSETLIPMLEKLCEPDLVGAVIRLAQELRLKNVLECLQTDFRKIAGTNGEMPGVSG